MALDPDDLVRRMRAAFTEGDPSESLRRLADEAERSVAEARRELDDLRLSSALDLLPQVLEVADGLADTLGAHIAWLAEYGGTAAEQALVDSGRQLVVDWRALKERLEQQVDLLASS